MSRSSARPQRTGVDSRPVREPSRKRARTLCASRCDGPAHRPRAPSKVRAAPDGARRLYAKDWVIYTKRPFGGPAQVLKYLAATPSRGHQQLLSARLRDGRVTFRYKDYADAHRNKTMTLGRRRVSASLRAARVPRVSSRFALRPVGQCAARGPLALCRRLLLVPQVDAGMPNAEAVAISGPTRCCLQCGGRRLIYRELAAAAPTSFRRPQRCRIVRKPCRRSLLR